MNILFITPSYKPAFIYGGTIVVIAQLAETLVTMGHQVTVYTTKANGNTELDVPRNMPVMIEGVNVFYFKRLTKDHTHASPALWKHLNKTVKTYDVIHVHSWWNFLVMGAVWICLKNGVRPIVSPHGMLSTYILQTNNSLKKKLLHNLIGKRLLSNTFLHVSTEMELQESYEIISSWDGTVIPNLVTLSKIDYTRKNHNVVTIGFLSRIDPKKGLDILIRALSNVNFPYQLLIAGSGEEHYIDSLKVLARELGNDKNIHWLGWKQGEDKFEFLSGLDLFALTSHSENFAIVVIEALSVGTPVLLSNNVGLSSYVQQNNFGWITDLDNTHITDTFNAAVLEEEKILRINNEVKHLIKKEYEDSILGKRYLDLYQYAGNKNKK